MKKQAEKLNSNKQHTLHHQLEELNILLEEKTNEKEQVQQELNEVQQEFAERQRIVSQLQGIKRSVKYTLLAIPAYLLGRRNPKKIYSKTYKRKDALNKLKKYKAYLYDLGFSARALKDLQEIYRTTDNKYMKKAAAWELGLWYANKLTKHDASQAIGYLTAAEEQEKDPDTLRKLAILKAECYELLGEKEAGQQLINAYMRDSKAHPDLYLAAANFEVSAEERIHWLNKVLDLYKLENVALTDASANKADAYYRLQTNRDKHQFAEPGPKVTVIIPAYNSEAGITIAIESMRAQTWNNLEILVVDDCSTDNTAKIVADFTIKDHRVKLLSTPQNSGPYVARNIALQQAEGAYVTVNDADDWSHPEKIEKQVNHLLANEKIIANTSEHARLTEDLKPYRRGMPGIYVFSNMSSIMFKKDPVLKHIGYWDTVRFAADSEFKNRLIQVFGKEAVVDLQTGPLSFPMHSAGSLTASSAFGYYGFLKGARKEYAESYRSYHKKTDTIYMPMEQQDRFYPVPEPMLPKREIKENGKRHIDIVIIADFRIPIAPYLSKQLQTFRELGVRTGLIQMGKYNLKIGKQINKEVREFIDGEQIQMLVYGEQIKCDILLIENPAIFSEKQDFIPSVSPQVVRVILTEVPLKRHGSNQIKQFDLRNCARNIDDYIHIKQKWYPLKEEIRKDLLENHLKELKSIPLSVDNWINEGNWKQEQFETLIKGWMVEENPYKLD